MWGWADPGEKIVVAFGGQTHATTAGDDGQWKVELEPLAASSEPLTLVVEGNESRHDSGRSGRRSLGVFGSIEHAVVCRRVLERRFGHSCRPRHPAIRFLTVENAGVQKPIQDFQGEWQVCSPETVGSFSAVGYFFGLQLHEILDVPIGLIDNAWGGSSCEAWVQRELLEKNPEQYGPLMQRWTEKEAQADLRGPYEQYEAALLQWQQDTIAAKKSGTPVPNQPPRPNSDMVTQHRPGNLFNGRVEPIMPYAIRGVIWYQGESNASRAYQYRHLFPLMIQELARRLAAGRFPVLLGATGRLPTGKDASRAKATGRNFGKPKP